MFRNFSADWETVARLRIFESFLTLYIKLHMGRRGREPVRLETRRNIQLELL